MSKVSEIREVCGDYALDVEYAKDYTFTMFFNSRRNAETVKRCIELDDSIPNVATAVDFVEVVRCKDCVYWKKGSYEYLTGVNCGHCERPLGEYFETSFTTAENDYCSCGERRTDDEG